MTIPQILNDQDDLITASVDAFKAELEKVVSTAKAKLQVRLHDALVLDAAGNIKRTRANAITLRKLSDWFMEEMAQAGFVQLSRAFVNSFPGQLPYFDQIVEELAKQAGKELSFEWTPRDKKAFTDYATHAQLSIETAVQNVATNVRSQVLLSFGAMPFKDLAGLLAAKLDVSVERAVTLADTALVVFSRTIAAQGYRKLEFHFDGVRYKYFGPPATDPLIRRFCKDLELKAAAGVTWSREEIDNMDNGQLPSVFVSGGGYNCRHHWALDIGSAKVPA